MLCSNPDKSFVKAVSPHWPIIGSVLVFGTVMTVILVWVPIGTAFQFGMDEGYEVMKAFLVYRGWELYDPIWNDQPPLLTLLLTAGFKLFGPTIFVARFVVVLFTSLLLATLWWLLAKDRRLPAALIGTAALALWPEFLKLGVSVMQIVPMLSAGLLAAALFLRALETDRPVWFLISGIMLGLALGIKLTAALFIPALMVEWSVQLALKPSGMRKRHCLLGAAFVLTSTGALLSVLLMTPAVGMESLLQPHFSAATYKASTPMAPSELVQRLFKANPALFITTAVGLPLLAIRKITEGRMPIVFLGTISIAHLIHRPFWSYYDLHFALPMAWISALAVYELVGIALRIKWQMRPFPWAGLSAYLGFSICLSLILTEIIVQGKTVASQLSMHGHLREGVGVTGLVRNPETVGLVYVDNMEAFHAGLAVVPELAVLSNKRRRAGLISPAQIEAIIRDRRPDLIQSARLSAPSASMKAWLAKHYRHSEGHSEFLVPVVN